MTRLFGAALATAFLATGVDFGLVILGAAGVMALAGDLADSRVGSFFSAVALRATGAFFADVVLPARRGRTRVSDVLKGESTSSQDRARTGAARSIEPNWIADFRVLPDIPQIGSSVLPTMARRRRGQVDPDH